MNRFAAIAALIICSVHGLSIAEKPTAGAPAVQRTTDDLMREQKSKEGKPRKPRLKVEREVEREARPNPKGFKGNSYTSETGARIDTPAPKRIDTPEPKAPQTIGTTFTAAVFSDAFAFPPDTMGTVGPTQFITFINGRIRTLNKSTGVTDGAINLDPDVFFSSVMTPIGGSILSNFTSDPHIRYDRFTKRWIMVIIDVPNGGGAANRILLAVSDAASDGIITGGTVWSFFFVQVSTNFADYPTLGIDNNALYIGTNMFTTAGDFVNTNAYVVRKSSILSVGPIVATTFTNLIGADGPYTPQGVTNLDPSATQGYFVGVSFANFGMLVFRRISDPAGTPTISGNISLNTLNTAFPVRVPHLGNANGANGNLDALDDRLYAATMRNGQLWTAHNIGVLNTGVASNSADRNASRWYEINNLGGSPALVQSGTIFDNAASNPLHFWIPTISVSGQGHAAMGFTVAGNLARINAATAGRLSTDANGTMQAPLAYTNSTTAYNPVGDPGSSLGRRFGDYSYVSVDPDDDMTMYTIQEFCNASNSYGVNVARLLAPPPATPITCIPPSVLQNTASTTITVTGTSLNGSAFFEPGLTFPNHIGASITGSVTVNSVFVINNTTVQIGINTTGAALGAQTIAIINPDGQQRSGAALLTIAPVPVLTPEIRLSATSHNYGSKPLGSTTDQVFTIFNDGDGSLQITSMTGLPSQGFSLVSPPSTPFAIPAGSSQDITVRYQPVSTVGHNATLTINSNDLDESNTNISLSGTGINCVLPGMTTSATSALDLSGAFTALAKVKVSATKGTSIKTKLSISQTIVGTGLNPTLGVPATNVKLYLIDSGDVPCTLPAPTAEFTSKVGKSGKPGKPAKVIKTKVSLLLAGGPSVTGKFLLAVLDRDNTFAEPTKNNNFAITGPLP